MSSRPSRLRRSNAVISLQSSPSLFPIQESSESISLDASDPSETDDMSVNSAELERYMEDQDLSPLSLSSLTTPPSIPLPQIPSSPYEEDHSNFANITISSESIKSLDLSTDSDPLVWMKKSCSNGDVSSITYLEYQDFEKLDLFNIRFTSSDGKSFQNEAQCISRQELLEWLSSDINTLPPSNIMSIYTSPKDMSPSNLDTGFTAKPTKRYVVRLPPTNFYVTLGSVHRLLSSPDRHWFALPLFGGKRRRVGNIFGYYGSSMNHGQVPGEVIYKLYTLDDLKSTLTVSENIDDYPLPIDVIKSDLSLPFIPVDEYISYLYGSNNSTTRFIQTLFKELFSTYIQNTRYSSPYSLINTLAFETSLSVDVIHQIFLKNKLVDINTQNTKGYTALMILLLNKFKNVPEQLFQLLLSYLLSKNPNVDITNDDDNSTAVMYAFKHYKISDPFLLLQFLNLSKNFDIRDKDGWDASMYAFNNPTIYQYPAQLVFSILNKTKDINRQERKFGWSLLMIIFKNASPHLSNKSIIDKIFSLNPNFNLQNKRGKTAFMYAAFNKNNQIHYSIFNRILSTNPNLDLQSLIGETVLSICLSSPYVSNNLVVFLLKHFIVNVNTQLNLENSIILDDDDIPPYDLDKHQYVSPLMMAIENPNVHPSVFSVLLSNDDLNIDHTNQYGETSLILSLVQGSSSDLIFSIIDAKPDINLQDNGGFSALSLALLNPSGKLNESVITRILDLSPNVNVSITNEKLSHLIIAIHNPSGIVSSSHIFKILSLNPDINHITESGDTALTACFTTLTRDDPSTFVPLDVFDFLITLPIDYTINKHKLINYMTEASLNLSVNHPNYFVQYLPIFDKIRQNLQSLN